MELGIAGRTGASMGRGARILWDTSGASLSHRPPLSWPGATSLCAESSLGT